MSTFTPTMTRTAIAKSLGFVFGLLGFYGTRTLMPAADPLLAWGVLALFLTIGGVVGIVGVIGHIPLVGWRFPPVIRGAEMGGWFAFLAVLFGYDMIAEAVASVGWIPAAFSSPWWMIVDGMVVGALIDVIASRLVHGLPDAYVTA